MKRCWLTLGLSRQPGKSGWAAALLAALVVMALGQVHLRTRTTSIGYELGRLKSQEAELMERRSELKMQLARLRTKQHLMLMAELDTKTPEAASPSLASTH